MIASYSNLLSEDAAALTSLSQGVAAWKLFTAWFNEDIAGSGFKFLFTFVRSSRTGRDTFDHDIGLREHPSLFLLQHVSSSTRSLIKSYFCSELGTMCLFSLSTKWSYHCHSIRVELLVESSNWNIAKSQRFALRSSDRMGHCWTTTGRCCCWLVRISLRACRPILVECMNPHSL